MNRTLLTLLIMFNLFNNLRVESKLVLTTKGIVKGNLVQYNGVEYYTYIGIPYAEKPVGDLRFKPPVPKPPWLTILDATKQGAVCPQAVGTYKKDQMSEDCLFLNIYAPKKSSNKSVFVHVHGGEFSKLSGNPDVIYGPELLLSKGMVVVTMNYRLGALGFLSLDIEEASGNAGIKDVLLALKWIKANIDCFGGNSKNITLSGNSAGAALAHFLTLTRKSSGLFQQATLISGSALGYRFLALHPKPNAFNLGQQLGFNTTDEHELLRNLKKLDPFDIVIAQDKMGSNDLRKGYRPYAPFVPCIEISSKHAIITSHPKEIIKNGIPINVPMLVGFNSKEGIKMLPAINDNQGLLNSLNNNSELLIPSNIEYPYGSKESEELAKSIRQYYFNNSLISNETIENYTHIIGDTQFYYPIDNWVKLHKVNENSNRMYYYLFSFEGPLNWFKDINQINYPGTAHADELGYMFVTKATRSKLDNLDTTNKQKLNTCLTIISNFVK